ANRDFANDGASRALEAVGVALLQLRLAATATTMTFVLFAGTRGTSERRLGLERRTMLRLLAIATFVVIVACLLDTTRLFLLAIVRRGRRSHFNRSFRCGRRWCYHGRARLGFDFGLRLAASLFV